MATLVLLLATSDDAVTIWRWVLVAIAVVIVVALLLAVVYGLTRFIAWAARR